MSTTGSRKMRLRKFDKLSHIPCLLAVPPLQVSQGSARELPMLCTVHAFVHMVSDGKEPPWYAMIKQSDETYETVPTSPGFGERKPGHPFIIVTKLVFGQLKHRRQTLRQTSSMEVQGIRRWTKLSTSVMVSWLTLSTTLTNHLAAQFNNQHRYVCMIILNHIQPKYMNRTHSNAIVKKRETHGKRHCFHRLRLEVLLLVPPQTSWIVTKPSWRSATITGEIDPQRTAMQSL